MITKAHVKELLHKLECNNQVDLINAVETAMELKYSLKEEQTSSLPVLDEECMELITKTLESVNINSHIFECLLSYLSDVCMRSENRELACNYGIPAYCTIFLHSSLELRPSTISIILDLVCTVAVDNAQAKESLNRCIPYIVSVLERCISNNDTKKEISEIEELMYNACIVLGTLSFNNAKNAKLIVECKGISELVRAFRLSEVRKVFIQQRFVILQAGFMYSLADKRKPGREFNEQNAEQSIELLDKIREESRRALLNICVSAPRDAEAGILKEEQTFKYGENVVVDELIWELKFTLRQKTKIQSEELAEYERPNEKRDKTKLEKV